MQLNKSVVRASSLQCWSVKVKMPLKKGWKNPGGSLRQSLLIQNFWPTEKNEFTNPKPVSSILSLSHLNPSLKRSNRSRQEVV